jgi:hypothetical protein
MWYNIHIMPKKSSKKFDKAYVVTVDMGYGHQRAVAPLAHLAAKPVGIKTSNTNIITANNYTGIPKIDKARWEGGRSIYETISRMKKLPIIGKYIFGIMNHLQRIEPFYPKRDLSRPIQQVKQIYRMIGRGWGRDLIKRLNKKPLPLITSFFSIAFFAEEHDYKGDIYCLCTDTDISRAWVPVKPQTSKIKYFAPNRRVRNRLVQYGVRKENIFVTGFPLPEENIGSQKEEILREDLGCRIGHLDPKGRYQKKYKHTLDYYLGSKFCSANGKHNLIITFAVGGAGAQRGIGITILRSLHDSIDKGDIHLNLVAGARDDVRSYYAKEVKKLHLDKKHGGHVKIIYGKTKDEYFTEFNKALRTTDILWTKPSELSFYAALGIPIIMAPTIGSQEEFNKAWLHQLGAGFEQEDPRYTHHWLFDWIDSGWLAQAAMEGFMDAPQHAVTHIENIVLKGKRSEIEDIHFL